MLFLPVLNHTLPKLRLGSWQTTFRSKTRDYLVGFVPIRSLFSTKTPGEEKLRVNYQYRSNLPIDDEQRKREEILRRDTIAKYLKKLRTREANLARPPLVYEGPVYINYWMRKRRSGARK